jgi:hypothetical protein
MSSQGAGKLAAIVGPNRSGTTWAGTLVDSSPDVIYRFEPFHRLSAQSKEAALWFERLKNQDVGESDLPDIYRLLCRANPLTNKAPFFRHKSYPLTTRGRELLWPLARMITPAQALYARAYSPRPGPPLVFKEVTFIKPLRNLLTRTTIPVVYLVRHPVATVLSIVRAPQNGTMASRHRKLERWLREHSPDLLERFGDIARGSDAISRTALLWRAEVETCVAMALRSERSLVMTYEELASDPMMHARRIFEHFGLVFGQETAGYIESLQRVNNPEGAVARTGWGRRYYSIHRNPAAQKDSWRKSAPAEDCRRIEAVVQGSPAIERCAAMGAWW